MIEIYRKEGWKLNPNDRVVNAILTRCEKCDGLCPCTDYRLKDVCECGLYMLDENYYSK